MQSALQLGKFVGVVNQIKLYYSNELNNKYSFNFHKFIQNFTCFNRLIFLIRKITKSLFLYSSCIV